MMTVTGAQDLRRALAEATDGADEVVAEAFARWGQAMQSAAARRASDPVQRRIAASAATTRTGKGTTVTFGGRGKLSGGAKLSEVTRPYEFGTSRQNVKTEYSSRHRISGKYMRVNRRTMKQLPDAKPTGHFIYPAMADTVPDVVSRIVRGVTEPLD